MFEIAGKLVRPMIEVVAVFVVRILVCRRVGRTRVGVLFYLFLSFSQLSSDIKRGEKQFTIGVSR